MRQTGTSANARGALQASAAHRAPRRRGSSTQVCVECASPAPAQRRGAVAFGPEGPPATAADMAVATGSSEHAARPASRRDGVSRPTRGGRSASCTSAATPSSDEGLDDDPGRDGDRGIERKRDHRSSPCSRARFNRLLNSRYSAGDSCVDRMSSSAAIAEPGRAVEERAHELLQRRPAGVLGLHRREVHEAGAVVLAREQAAIDHDVEQLAHAGRARRVRQLGADILDRRAAAAVAGFP